MIVFFLVLLLIFLIFLSAFFSASETALFSLSVTKVKILKQEGGKNKTLVAALLASPRDLLITIIMLNIVANILVQNVVSSLFGEYSAWLLNVGVPLALTLVFGEVIPKSLALANNEAVAIWVAPVMYRAQRLLLPVRRVMTSITNVTSRFMFFFLRKEKEISVDELLHALKTSRQYGVLIEEEAELISGYLQLEESSVKVLMRPREEVLFFDISDPLNELIHLFVDQECSRIPICRGGLDHVLGIMSSRLFFMHRSELKTANDLLSFLQKPFFVPSRCRQKPSLDRCMKNRCR